MLPSYRATVLPRDIVFATRKENDDTVDADNISKCFHNIEIISEPILSSQVKVERLLMMLMLLCRVSTVILVYDAIPCLL